MIVAGIDVSKNELHAHAEGEDRRFANDGTGIGSLRRWLRTGKVERVVIEPTGRFQGAILAWRAFSWICQFTSFAPIARSSRRFV